MSRYLLTHSLLSSWMYAIAEDPYEDATSERDRYAEFLQTLRRVETPTTAAMQFGIDFEDLVMGVLIGAKFAGYHWETKDKMLLSKDVPIFEHPWYDAAQKVAQIVKGGQFQCKVKKEITVSGITFLLYGRLDVLKAGEINDIKFSKSYDRGKYFDSTQHPTYMELVPEARRFRYIISNGREVWTETYEREETPDICPIISDFADWLTGQGLLPVYKDYWEAK